MSRFRSCILLFSVFGLCAWMRAEPLVADALVATVNGESITMSEVLRQIRPYLQDSRKALPRNASDDERFDWAYRKCLTDLENRRLVVQKYWEGDARIPDTAIDRIAAETLEDRYGGNYAELQKELAEDKMTYAEWKDALRDRMIVASMRQTYAETGLHVSPTEISRAYEARKGEFTVPDTIHLFVAAIPAADTNAVARFPERLAAGESFEALAKEMSVDLSAKDGGDYGFVDPAEEFAPVLAKAAFALSDGQTTPGIPVGPNVYFLRRTESKPGHTTALPDVWDTLEKDLLAEKREAKFLQWVERLRASSQITETAPMKDDGTL